MSAAQLAIGVSLLISVSGTLACCIALIAIKDVFGRMHYLAPITSVTMCALLTAVVIREGWSVETGKTVLVLFVLLLVNAVLTHATARAARIRLYGHWSPQTDEHIPTTQSSGPKS